MKKKKIFSIILVIFVISGVVMHGKTNGASQMAPQLKAELTSDKKIYNYGETPVFTLTIQNISNEPLKLWINASDDPRLPEDYIFGTIVQTTQPPVIHHHIQGRIVGYKGKVITLNPGQEIKCHRFSPALGYSGLWNYIGFLDGVNNFNFKETGDNIWKGVVVSNILTIEFKGPHERKK